MGWMGGMSDFGCNCTKKNKWVSLGATRWVGEL